MAARRRYKSSARGARSFVTQIGEGFAGEGGDSAHVNTVLGARGGPAEAAFATALAQPSPGHTPFLVVLKPGLPVKPFTLFVSKATVTEALHGKLTWGAAQAGVAQGVAESVAAGVIPRALVDALVLIAAVWVSPEARDEEAVYRNNLAATCAALAAGAKREPRTEDVLAARGAPENPYFRK
ncbi:MAG: formaldehyde-activating enzyme [Deltaproteobacteria bacterium]|nr:formaldehyde-activating enzyme [Deltaproteobacteria bacterium]